MKKTLLFLGTLGLGAACSSEGAIPTASTQNGRPAADRYGVRVDVGGGEATDFGNGSQPPCGSRSVEERVLTPEEAEQAGLDVEADRTSLALPHVATLRWNPVECEVEPELCEPTELDLGAQLIEPVLVTITNSRPDDEHCPAQEQYLVYRAAISIESEDGKVAGTFYDTVSREESGDGVIRFNGSGWHHLWNFEGELPIELDLARSHYAYMSVSFSLGSDGSAAGELEPRVGYYAPPSTDGSGGAAGAGGAAGDDNSWRWTFPRIGPDALFGTREKGFDDSSVLALDGARSTLTTYPGSVVAPLVDLTLSVNAFSPEAEVDLTIWVDGEQVYDQSVDTGTVELGPHPLGTPVVVDVHNSNGAGTVRSRIEQNTCIVASSECADQDCTLHLEYTADHMLCYYGDGAPVPAPQPAPGP